VIDNNLSIERGIKLFVDPTNTKVLLKWEKLYHTAKAYSILQSINHQLNYPSWGMDMAAFLLTDVDDAVKKLARTLHDNPRVKPTAFVSGVTILESSFKSGDKPTTEDWSLDGRISGMNVDIGCCFLGGAEAPAGASGLGLEDRKKKIVGIIVGYVKHKGADANRNVLILSLQYIKLIRDDIFTYAQPPSTFSSEKLKLVNSLPTKREIIHNQLYSKKRKR
jgi:hypothetical protein